MAVMLPDKVALRHITGIEVDRARSRSVEMYSALVPLAVVMFDYIRPLIRASSPDAGKKARISPEER